MRIIDYLKVYCREHNVEVGENDRVEIRKGGEVLFQSVGYTKGKYFDMQVTDAEITHTIEEWYDSCTPLRMTFCIDIKS